MPNQQESEEFAVVHKVSDTLVAQVWTRDAEDDFI
jgi:hypothetical protein